MLNLSRIRNVAVALDVSGGIPNDTFRRTFEWLDAEFTDQNVHVDVWTFDTHVRDHKTFSPYRPNNINAFKNIRAGGGTILGVNWAHMRAKNIKPDLFIVVGDGFYMFDMLEEANYCPTLWAIYRDVAPNGFKPPFGEVIGV